MKIPLVGESYALRSPAAAVQQTMNLIPQFIDDPNEHGKNKGIQESAPGYHQMGDLNTLGVTTGHVVRATASGGGRCFFITDSGNGVPGNASTLWEVGLGSYVGGNPSTGASTLVSKTTLSGGVSDGKPGQMYFNGNQLLVVKDGYAWLDNGSGPNLIRFLISGSLNTVSNGDGTSTATWVSGDKFTTAMNGGAPYGTTFITINGVNYLITTYTSATSLLLTEDAGNQSGALYTSPAGDFLTAVTGAYLDSYFIVQRPIGKYTIAGQATSATRTITWNAGSFFSDLLPGDAITFNNLLFVVDTVDSPTQITVTATAGAVTANFSASVGSDLGRQFNICFPNDGLFWDPLDFAQKEGYPDHLSTLVANNEQLILLGVESMEPWQNTGNALFPFQRIPGAVAKEGSIATFGAAVLGERIYYLGGPPSGPPGLYRLDGFTPVRVSTHAEEAAWASGIDTPSLAVTYAEVHDGHHLIVVNFPGALNSWVYDETASQQSGTPVWSQRAAWTGAAFAPYAPRFHTFVPEWGPAGMHVVGDFASGKFHELNLNYFDDNGADKKWVRTFPHLYAGGMIQYFGRMTLEMETGSTSSLLTEPLITRDYSDDRGNTFVNPVTKGAGVNAAFAQRVYWPSNGSSRDRVWRLSGTGQYRVTLIDLDLDVEVGTS